jgi:hypothetical protein
VQPAHPPVARGRSFFLGPFFFRRVRCNAFLGSHDAQRRAQYPSQNPSNAMSGKKARARKKKKERHDANAADTANAGEAIPGLLNDIVVTHFLRSGHFDDPADLARLPAVSRAMRDAVAATGLQFKQLTEEQLWTLDV